MSQYKTFTQNAMVQDFKHKGNFQGKEEILSRLSVFHDKEQEQDNIDFADLDFSKAKDLSENQIIAKLHALKKRNEMSFDFANECEIEREIQELENQQIAISKQYRSADQKDNVLTVMRILGKTVVYGILCGFVWVVFQAWPKESKAVSIANIPVETTKQPAIQPIKAPLTKEQFNAMLLDGVAKQAAMSQQQFQEQTPKATIDQMNRIGQMVLDLANNNNKGDEK
jgi:hypothetical protein